MELSETALNILLGLGVLVLMVVNFIIRKKKSEGTPLGMVVTILEELRFNDKHTEDFSYHRSFGKFRTSNWNKYKVRLAFIPTNVMMTVSKAMDMCDEVNERISTAKRYGSDSYMAAIDVEKLKKPVEGAKDMLYNWLQENMDDPELQPKRRSMLGGSLFGGR